MTRVSTELHLADVFVLNFPLALEERRDQLDEVEYEEAIKELNSGLLDLNTVRSLESRISEINFHSFSSLPIPLFPQLHGHFCQRFGLHECTLGIMHLAGALAGIENVWIDIIDVS